MTFDPYDELGVSRTANSMEVRAGYKRQARKTHPDAPGGSEEAFKRTGRALMVLENPEKRAQFDKDGTIPEDENPTKKAVKLIADIMSAIFAEYFSKGFKPELDPAKMDFVDAVSAELERKIAQKRAQLRISDKMRESFTDVRSRIKGTPSDGDPMRDVMTASLRDQATGHDLIVKELEVARIALGFLRHYSFKIDEALAEFVGRQWR